MDNIKNLVDFAIRQRTKFSRKNYSIKPEEIENLFGGSLAKRETELQKKYDFSVLKRDMTCHNYCENLYTLDILDKYLLMNPSNDLKVLDIGSKNWFYAKAEHVFFKAHCQNLVLKGIEIDAFRLYNNLYSRYEVAKFNIKNLSETYYIADDFLNINEKFDCIIWILPFITQEPHVRWGLPLKHFQPEKLLEHAYNSLTLNGKIFIINQGEKEYSIQKALIENMNIGYMALGEIESDFLKYNHNRFGLVIEKK